MEGEENVSPSEQLAAEVAGDTSETGEVTADDVAEVLNLPKPKKETGGDTGDDNEESDEDSDSADADDADDSDDSGDDSEELDEGGGDQEEAIDTDERQFTLTVKDANGKEFTIEANDDLEKVLEDFEPKSNGQIMAILDKINTLKADKAKYASEQEESSKQAAYKEHVSSIRTGWDEEIATLQGDKRIPVEADGKVPARVTEVFKFMRETNDQRLKVGRPLLESFEDALDKLELKESKDEAVKKNKAEKDLARKRGAIVGGSSAAASSSVSNYKRGARNPVEALKQMGILR